MFKRNLLLSLSVLALSARLATAGPAAVVVFNELQYNPPGQAEDGEWLELFNQMGIKVDLSGWRIDGIGYTFPSGTIIDPGAYLVVAKTPAAGQLGPFTGSLSNSGEQLRLINQSERLMDELDYGDDDRWPAAADGSGATLAKLRPYTANKPPEAWAASGQVGGTPGTANFPDANTPPPTTTVGLLELADEWRYNESGDDLGAAWASAAHPIGGDWELGAGGIGSESGPPFPVATSLSFPAFNNPYVVTYYFEREFDLSAAQIAGLQSLNLRHGFDDGAVVFLNGNEVLRVNMPGGAVSAETLALDSIEVEALSSNVPLASGALLVGSNRISIEVHQGTLGSSDVLFGVELDAEIAGAMPGAAPLLKFNEIPGAGEPSFWAELVNAGPAAIDLGGIKVTAAADGAREYLLPAGSLQAGAILLLDEATLGFRPADGEKLFLYDSTSTVVLDARQQTGRLRGLSGDAWLYPSAATPGASNAFAFNSDVVISEIAYNPPGLPARPAVPPTFDATLLVSMGDSWRYNRADESLPSSWAATAHAAGGNWEQAPGPIGRESSALPVALATSWSAGEYDSGTVAYYFETEFTVDVADLASIDSLEITHMIDDGAVFYLNGTEVGRFNMPGGAISPETLANPSVGNASLNTLEIPLGALVAGVNRLSIETHQSSTGSSDMVFGVQLDARVLTAAGTPGLPFRNSDNQWLEIANRGAGVVDLGGWQFSDGIDFSFPIGTMLAPGEHACVVEDATLFAAAFPGARMLGQYSGSLSRSGERLELRDANRNPVDIVRFYDGGAWPSPPDGGGATLELVDLDADNAVGGAWAASDESGGTAWRTYTYTETAAGSRGPDGQWSEFNMGMLGAGEILIDDISVTSAAQPQRISDGGFDDPSAWRLRGNHRHSEIIDDPDQPGNRVLRLISTGPTGHMHNQVETTLTSGISNGQSYTISFRARWVSGISQLHTRLYFNRCANVNVLDRPSDPGTPSAPNSRALANIGPTLSGLKHSPAVPAVNQATKISVAASDPDGVTGLTLFYSVNGATFQNVPMGPSGGRYEASVPGQPASAIVQFYISADDGVGASTLLPPRGEDGRALYKVDDGSASGTGIHNFRIVMTAADVAFQHVDTEVMSNDRLGCTVIDREGEIYYDCGVRLKSSQRGRNAQPRVGYNLRFPPDGLYRGSHETIAIDRSLGVGTGQMELLFDMMISNSGGVLSRYYDFVKILAPNTSLTGGAVFQMGRYDNPFLDSQFENGSEGARYEYELIYYPTTTDSNGLKRPQPDSVTGVSVGDASLGDDEESYRWFFLNKMNREADNFEPIITYSRHFSKSGAAFDEGLEDIVDVDDWFRGMAYGVLSGAGDNASANSQHNGMYYAKPDGRVMFLPHDMDFAFDAGRSIFANSECAKLASDQVRRRIYLGHLHDIITTTYNNGYMSMWTSHFAALDPSQPWSSHLSYMNSRSNNVLSQINGAVAPVGFNITTSSPLTVAGATATISGDGWVDVREIRIQGSSEPLAVTWTDNNSWEVSVPAPPGSSSVTLEAVNFSGEVIATDTISINNTTPSEPASSANLAISEIMYHPADPSAEEIGAGVTDADQFEYVELMNIGSALVDLTGVRFVGGIDYDFAPSTTLDPGDRIVLVRDRSAYLLRHAAAGAVLAEGAFLNGTGLANGGESLQLRGASGADIRSFSYDDDVPWPVAADGAGYSLVLIAPESNPDHAIASNWRSSTSPGGNPGSGDATVFAGDPDADADSDGLSAFMEYALGTSDQSAGNSPLTLSSDSSGTLTFNYPRNLAADDASLVIELSTDLDGWDRGAVGLEPVSEIPQGDGTSMVTWSYTIPVAQSRLFVRLVAESNP